MSIEKYEQIKPKNKIEIIDENTYIKTCVDCALRSGWVKPEKKDILINEYLLPIYRKYIAVIEEIRNEVASESDAEELISKIINHLNHILEITQRIGSTDHNNITRSIYDYRHMFCYSNTYLEYAATSLADFIHELLYSKS